MLERAIAPPIVDGVPVERGMEELRGRMARLLPAGRLGIVMTGEVRPWLIADFGVKDGASGFRGSIFPSGCNGCLGDLGEPGEPGVLADSEVAVEGVGAKAACIARAFLRSMFARCSLTSVCDREIIVGFNRIILKPQSVVP